MVPEKRIVRKVKAYDPNLFIKWNNQFEFFELWMKHKDGGAIKITPITRSIYNSGAPRDFVELDERLLMWIYEADSAKDSKNDYISTFKYYDDFRANINKYNRDEMKYRAKDLWHGMNNFFATKEKAKNGPPKFNKFKRPSTPFIRPDAQRRTSNRIYQRSTNNARMFNWRG